MTTTPAPLYYFVVPPKYNYSAHFITLLSEHGEVLLFKVIKEVKDRERKFTNRWIVATDEKLSKALDDAESPLSVALVEKEIRAFPYKLNDKEQIQGAKLFVRFLSDKGKDYAPSAEEARSMLQNILQKFCDLGYMQHNCYEIFQHRQSSNPYYADFKNAFTVNFTQGLSAQMTERDLLLVFKLITDLPVSSGGHSFYVDCHWYRSGARPVRGPTPHTFQDHLPNPPRGSHVLQRGVRPPRPRRDLGELLNDTEQNWNL